MKQPTKLVIFDIDGTLTESNEIDGSAYIQALNDTFGFKGISADWGHYTHVTDFGIFEEIYQLRRGFLPTCEEIDCFKDRFFDLLFENTSKYGGIKPIKGASVVLNYLLNSHDYALAYASGAWKVSALLKLRSAGLPVDNIPRAFSDDDHSREGICKVVLARAEEYYRCQFQQVVYVGDGVWDIRCARNLGYGFIGISNGEGVGKLIAEGAIYVLPDYQDVDLFFSLLESACQKSARIHL
jgi:phosphoglycolate phosphatase-like HAD superfamily hydrolase